jgi:hypothetical protein
VSAQTSISSLANGEYDDNSLFGFSSKLIFGLSNNSTNNTTYDVGSLTLYSSNKTVITRVVAQAIIPTLGMMIGMALLIFLVKRLFKTLLTTPLETLSCRNIKTT